MPSTMKCKTVATLPAILALLCSCCLSSKLPAAERAELAFTPPAVPLVACDPYFSIWSPGKKLTDESTMHWTGKRHQLSAIIRIDGKPFRVMGSEPSGVPALEQTSLRITPTRTIYGFQGAGVAIELTFMTPALPSDIDLLSRPITYVTFSASSQDGKTHNVQTALSAGGEIAVNVPSQEVEASTVNTAGLLAQKIGSVEQNVLGRSGDDLRIDWGYFYVAAGQGSVASSGFGKPSDLLSSFAKSGNLGDVSKEAPPQPASDLASAVVLKTVEVKESPVQQYYVLAYDDLYSIEFNETPLRPYWRRDGMDAKGLLSEAVRDYASLVKRCAIFDQQLTDDLNRVGGPEYVQIASLAYRQCFAAGKFVADANGQPIEFCKENNSNGCIATSDVFYPMAPQYLLFGPSLAKSFVAPFMEYAASDRWKFDFAPHDLGTYPKANGQVYGGGERSEKDQMPVEESGNMLILMAAIARLDGNANFAARYWPQLLQWAEYLQQQGYDPDRQLCTDDFAGHMAHNVNLSAKAICGLGAFAMLCEMRGDEPLAREYRATAERFAAKWIEEADDGDHFRLAFDKPGTWSQKYNLVWDKVLDLNLFPESVFKKEMAYYRSIQNKYGLPLDNRREYTKLDWVLWTATLTENREDFDALVHPVHRFLQETPDRVPMTDWYETVSGRKVGFKARPVVGGVFMAMLYDDEMWNRWASQDETKASGYADLPRAPKTVVVVPAADTEPVNWRYSMKKPSGQWHSAQYDDSSWRIGQSGFGTSGTPSAAVGTRWSSSDIWIRREFDMPKDLKGELRLYIHHDEDAEVYINGVLAKRLGGYTASYSRVSLRPEIIDSLKPKGNVFAVHCRQSSGGQYIDLGLVAVVPDED